VVTWRLIPPLCAAGAVQMAIDAWLFEQHLQGLQPPSLRFYTWQPAAISLGYHQRQFPDDWKTLTWNDQPLDLVRRPTGGRAVLHQGDLTYSVVTSGLPNDRRRAYQAICEFLIQGWRSLGVDLVYGQAGRGYIHNPNCFGTATAADLVIAGSDTKLIGSAQLRNKGVVLQHGSMRLCPSPDLFEMVFDITPDLPKISFDEGHETIIEQLVEAAKTYFDAQFVVQPLSQQEWGAIAQNQALLNLGMIL